MKKNSFIIYKLLIAILVIIAIIIGSVIFKKQYDDHVYDKENISIAEEFKKQIKDKPVEIEDESKSTIDLKYQGYNVIGIIQIPAINLEYPIIEKTTKATMKTSISRFYGGAINEYGNVSLAGHNNYSGKMFGKNRNLKLGDKILLTDIEGKTIEYDIYKIFTTNPNDTSILETTDKTIREVTLITCKNGRSERLIIKAKAE